MKASIGAGMLVLALGLPASAQTADMLAATPAPGSSQTEDGQVELTLGTGLVCDTQAQVERYAQLFEGDAEAAAEAVNRESGQEDACMFGTIAYVQGRDVARVERADATFNVAEVLVLGIGTEIGVVQIEPVKWYTLMQVDELRA